MKHKVYVIDDWDGESPIEKLVKNSHSFFLELVNNENQEINVPRSP